MRQDKNKERRMEWGRYQKLKFADISSFDCQASGLIGGGEPMIEITEP